MVCFQKRQLLFVLSLGLGACTTPTAWFGEGTEGKACFPDGTCDPGLECRLSVCTRPITTTKDGGPRLDQPITDGRQWDIGGFPPDTRSCVDPPPPPELKPVVANTAYATVVIRGRAAQATEVIVTGGADTQSAPVQDGLFCLEVELIPNATSVLLIVSVNDKDCYSDPVGVKISQTSVVSRQLLSGLTPEVSIYPDQNKPLDLVDGKTTKSVSFSFFDMTADCDNFVYLWFDLKASYLVDSLVVHYPQQPNLKTYLQCWQLLGSTKNFPNSPEPGHPQWFVLAEGSSTTESVKLTLPLSGVVTSHLALLAFENAEQGYNEQFEFTEIEAFGHEILPPLETCP